jgi:predicted phosphodiesterase
VVVGNHDVPFGNVGFVANQPIGTVLSQPFVKRSLSFDDPSLKIVTHDFDPAFVKSDLDQYKRDGAKFLVVCAHQNFLEHGQLPKEPTVNFDEIHADIDVLAFGHIHTPTVLTKVNNIWFVNPGAMMRGTLHKDNLQREVNVIVMRFDEDIKFKKFALNIVPSDQIFDLEKKERKDAHDDRISAFVEMLGSTSASSLSSDPTTVLDAIDTDERVKELARMYLDGGSIDVDAV